MPVVYRWGDAGTVEEMLSIGVRKLRKLDMLEYTYYIISNRLLIDSVSLEVFQSPFFIKTIKSTVVRGTLESLKLSDGCCL